MDEKWMDELRDRACGEKKGIEEVLLVQLLTNPGMDINSMLPFLFLGGTGFGRNKLALVAFMLASQQQSQALAAAGTSGVPAPPANNMLPLLLLLLGDLGGHRSGFRSRHDEEEEEEAEAVK